MSEPIWMDCEGGGCPPTCGTFINSSTLGMCAMCGKLVAIVSLFPERRIEHHRRQDVLAMIDRGDFG